MRRDLHRQHAAQRGIVERRHRAHDGDGVQPGEIPTQDKPALRDDDDHAGGVGDGLGKGEAQRRHQLREMIAQDLNPVQGPGQVVKEPAQRIRHRLGFEMIIQAGQILPARVGAQLDQAGAEHHAEQDPAPDPDQRHLRYGLRRSTEDCEEAGFEQDRFPPKAVEGLSHVHEREIENPESGPNQNGRPKRVAGYAAQRDTR